MTLFELVALSGYYLNENYEFLHDFLFQTVSLSVLIWAVYKTWRNSTYVISLSIIGTLLLAFYAFSHVNPRKHVLDVITLTNSRIYISEYGAHATTKESIIVEKV
jgi:uncharacterized membrane protein (UPF0136 family)